MLQTRVIPFLLLQNNRLVKSKRFKYYRYVGDPVNAIKIFNDKEVDEIVVLDIEASKENRGPNFDQIEQMASECFIPLCYGGGITKPEQAGKLFALGVEKVCIQSGALKNLDLVSRISEKHGRQSLVVSVDVKKDIFGKYKLYSSADSKKLKMPYLDFVKKSVEAGAGEIVINSVDHDGMKNGLDLNLVKEVSGAINVPTIAIGGVGSLEHILDGIKVGARAVGAGSYFVFYGPHEAVLITYPKYNVLQKLLRGIHV
jgi:cyclase